MEFKEIYKKITNSPVFENFIKNHPDAELVAGFFIIDFLEDNNQRALDYKDKDKIFTFSLNKNNEITLKQDKLIETSKHPKLTKIYPKTNIKLNELKSIAKINALDNRIKSKFQKIIAVLQNYENKQIWNLTCILENMIILNILIDSETSKIIKFEKKNLMDFIKKK